jgi:2-aminoethylphosphonate-pyruvate transaminase
MSLEKPNIEAPRLGEPFLLTPGPLTTSYDAKAAMLKDWGSWDGDFRQMTQKMRDRLIQMLGKGNESFDCVPMQGSGSFSVEAMLGSFVPKTGKVLVLSNGAYGQRAAKTLNYLKRDCIVLDKGDYLPPRGEEVSQILSNDKDITHVVAVHCETSSGILNPIEEISTATYKAGRKLLVDSMSAFGAIPVEPDKIKYEAIVSSANKCIEGVPGFGFILARKSALEAAKGNSHSLCLDLHDQWSHMNKTGQWRYTPPTHALAAFLVALEAHRKEGGVGGRGARYTKNRDTLVSGMRSIGFETLLSERWLSPIIVTFFCPKDSLFDFTQFYDLMKSQGFIIYPGKLTIVESFRIGCIGQMDDQTMLKVVDAANESLKKMGVTDASPPTKALEERKLLQS